MFPTLNRIESRINSAIIEIVPIVSYYSYDEVLLSNVIGNDLQSVLRPLNLMQALFICSKYKIIDNTVTVNSFTYNVIGVVCVFLLRVYFFYGWFNKLLVIGFGEGVMVLLDWSSTYDNCVYTIGFILNYYCNIKYRHKNVSLVTRIQHAITLLKLNSKELRGLKIYNWITVMSVNSVFIGTLSILIYFFFEIGYFNLLISYSIIILDINVMYASFVMKLLCKLLIAWTEDLRRAEHIIFSDSERESYWNIKYDVYVDIMEAYKLVEKTYGWLIAHYTINTACHGLIHIATILYLRFMWLNAVLFGITILVSQVWLATSILIGISLSVNCERFYKALTDVRDAVIPLMYTIRCSDKHTLSVCKNIQRLQDASFRKIACGLFVVDALMSLHLFSFITTYTIVLIQFEFL